MGTPPGHADAKPYNLRLELGHHLEPQPIRTTEFAPALPPAQAHAAPPAGYAPAKVALPFKQGRFSGRDFVLQPDGTLRCPAGQALATTEERREADGSLRVVYAARISQCRGCELRTVPVARPRHAEATPGECAPASPQDRFSSLALEGLESSAASPRLHAGASASTG